MKYLTFIRSYGGALKLRSLALGVIAALVAGSAGAATTTATYDLGASGSGTFIAGGASILWLAQGTLPAGSILREVSINATLDDNPADSWASDLNVVVDGLLQIGSDGGQPDWANGQHSTVGTAVTDTKIAGVDFPATVDLNAAGLFLKNTWAGATWSGTVTVTYDILEVAGITSFGLPGNPARINETQIDWTLPFGTNVTALAPTFTLSAGATCDPVSGAVYDFSSPVHYVVTSADGLTIKEHTVTVRIDVQWGWLNVNFDTTARTGLVGPAGGAGATWNEQLGTAGFTAGSLRDASGAATTVGFTCNASNVYAWGNPDLKMLTAAAFSFASDPVNLGINGLKPGMKYVLYLASYHPYESGGRSLFSTGNPTTTSGTQIADTGGPDGKSYRWLRGVNYVRFDNIVPDAANCINITMTADRTSGARAYLSGFQLVEDPSAPTCPYAGWLAGWDFSAYTQPDLSLDGDPDGDLLTNMEEFLMGLNPTVADRRPGVLTVEYWNGISGATVGNLFASAKFFAEPDTVTFKGPSDLKFTGPYAGTRSRGYITPTTTGDYTFWLSARTSADLWLSSDLSKGKYAKQRIAAMGSDLGQGSGIAWDELNLWDWFASQQSAPVHLEAGQAYYMEIDHKGGSEALSHARIAWARNDSGREFLPDAVAWSYVRTAEDADDDCLPDAWESQVGLDPADNGATDPARQGERGDCDGDGLTNRDEYLLGTNPADSDTDGDGLSDREEAKVYGTDPTVSDASPEQLAGTVAPASVADLGTGWTATAGGVLTTSFRGRGAWNFVVPTAGYWVVQVETMLRGDSGIEESIPVEAGIDGWVVARTSLDFINRLPASLRVFTPYLPAGQHQLDLFIDNRTARTSVEITAIKVLRPAGLDLDHDGRSDAVESQLAKVNRISGQVVVCSPVSPAFIEGLARTPEALELRGTHAGPGSTIRHKDAFWAMEIPRIQSVADHTAATLAAAPATDRSRAGALLATLPGPGRGTWFARIALEANQATRYTAFFENGSIADAGVIVWTPLNLIGTTEVSIPVGSQLLMGAWEGETDNSVLNFTIGAESREIRAKSALPWLFETPGDHLVSVVHQASGTTHTLNVRVRQATLPVDLGVVEQRFNQVALPGVAPDLTLDTGGEVGFEDFLPAAEGGSTVRLMGGAPGSHRMAARMMANGPILDVAGVTVTGVSDALRNLNDIAVPLGNGLYLMRTTLLVTNLPPGGTVKVSIFAGGVTFPDGTTVKTFTAADFDDNGLLILELLMPATRLGAPCHYIEIFDAAGRRICGN